MSTAARNQQVDYVYVLSVATASCELREGINIFVSIFCTSQSLNLYPWNDEVWKVEIAWLAAQTHVPALPNFQQQQQY